VGPVGTSREIAHVATARELFLTVGSVEAGAVRQPILASWQRSRVAGVDASRFEVPYQPELDFSGRLVHCAQPVLDRLQRELSDLAVSVILTDARARVLDRRVAEGRLHDRLDDVSLAPGFSYAEEHAGTNGIGTALEGRETAFVFGHEHFNERLQQFACAGAPIRNPLTRRLEGIIDLTCLRRNANPIMRVLVQEAARDIEQALLEHGSTSQQAVLREFLAACARSRNAILSISGELVMTNTRAAALLTPTDQAYLRQKGGELLANPRAAEIEVCLSGRQWSRVRFTPVGLGAGAAGAIMEIDLPASGHSDEGSLTHSSSRSRPTIPMRDTRYSGLVGTSSEWLAACREMGRAAAQRAPVLLIGETGVGKLALATAAHRNHFPTAHVTVLDCAQLGDIGEPELDAALADPEATVILRHLDALPDATATALHNALDHARVRPETPWLMGTIAGTADSVLIDGLLSRFAVSVAVPPLRHRVDDVAALVPAILSRLASGRQVSCEPEAMRVLSGYLWPGNVAQLEQVLRTALSRRPVGDIRREDLPVECFATSRRTLSPLETAERDLIVKALLDAGGNRVKAAAALGIGRATLYRKISTFGIEHVGQRH